MSVFFIPDEYPSIDEIARAICQHYHAVFRKLLDTLEPLTTERVE
ncbi:hypothetical protein [Chlorobium phaeobacteroides]|jgi:hypothetical protein|nr:hypothetical protein [Chlorobium phaeobacteroides]